MVPHAGGAPRLGAPVDGDVFPDEVVIADDGVALLTGEGVVLGVVAHDGPEADEVIFADGGVGADVGVGQNPGAGPDAAGAVNNHPGAHRHVRGQFHGGGYPGARVNGHRCLFLG